MDLEDFNNNNCIGYDINSFNLHVNVEGLCILNFNIRSFRANIDSFLTYVQQLKIIPDIIVLTETWFSENQIDFIPGYKQYNCCRKDRIGGGVSIFFRADLKLKSTLMDSNITENAETLTVNLRLNSGLVINIVGIYRPPSSRCYSGFLSEIEQKLESLPRNENNVFIGDFNVDLLSRTNFSLELSEMMKSYYFWQMITVPTHESNQGNGTLIDHIWCNIFNNCESGVFHAGITDHDITFTIIPMNFETENMCFKFRDHSETCLVNLMENLGLFVSEYEQVGIGMNFCDKISYFYNRLYHVYNVSCPIRVKYLGSNKLNKPWIDSKLLLMIQRKHYLYKRYRTGALEHCFYKSYCNLVANKIKFSKKNYYLNKFNYLNGDARATWKLTNSIIGRKSKNNNIGSLNINGTLSHDDLEMANEFNDYFSSIGVQLDSKINSSANRPENYMGESNPNTFRFHLIDSQEVTNVINSFPNKSCRLESIPIKIFKLISNIISHLLADLYNESIFRGRFPKELGNGRIIPILKSGSRLSASNFRPICTLPLLSKLFEKLVYKRFISFIYKFKILYEKQFGFRTGTNTTDALLEYLD